MTEMIIYDWSMVIVLFFIFINSGYYSEFIVYIAFSHVCVHSRWNEKLATDIWSCFMVALVSSTCVTDLKMLLHRVLIVLVDKFLL